MTPPGYLDISYLRMRVRAHQLSEAGWDSSEIARSLGLNTRQVNRYLALHKPLLVSPPSNQSWVDDAVCRPHQTELFFPTSTGNANRNSKRQAVATCRRCPVTEKCFQAAIDNCERVGVWGGRDMADYSYSFDEATGGVKVSVRGAGGSLQNVG